MWQNCSRNLQTVSWHRLNGLVNLFGKVSKWVMTQDRSPIHASETGRRVSLSQEEGCAELQVRQVNTAYWSEKVWMPGGFHQVWRRVWGRQQRKRVIILGEQTRMIVGLWADRGSTVRERSHGRRFFTEKIYHRAWSWNPDEEILHRCVECGGLKTATWLTCSGETKKPSPKHTQSQILTKIYYGNLYIEIFDQYYGKSLSAVVASIHSGKYNDNGECLAVCFWKKYKTPNEELLFLFW